MYLHIVLKDARLSAIAMPGVGDSDPASLELAFGDLLGIDLSRDTLPLAFALRAVKANQF